MAYSKVELFLTLALAGMLAGCSSDATRSGGVLRGKPSGSGGKAASAEAQAGEPASGSSGGAGAKSAAPTGGATSEAGANSPAGAGAGAAGTGHAHVMSDASAGVSGGGAGAGGTSEAGTGVAESGGAGGEHGHVEPAAGSGVDAAGSGGSSAAAGAGGEAGSAGNEHAHVPAGGAGAGGMSDLGGTGAGAGGAGGMGAAGAGAAATGGGMGGGGSGGMPAGPTGDHCIDGEKPSAADAALSGKPDYWTDSKGAIDLVLPKGVLDWMGARVWEVSHDAWHNIRRCKGSTIPGASRAVCQHTELVPASQECSGPDDGYQFLVMHRHMIIALKQAFPEHKELFEGFPHFPFQASEVPEEWRDRWGSGWSQSVRNTATVLEDIENRLSQFPSEGSLGQYIQCGGMGSLTNIHGALHFKWVVNESPYSLGKQTVNIDNYMFWKLHGWIDGIWERYRVAKGIAPDDTKLRDTLVQQCHEMHALGVAVGPKVVDPDPDPLPAERGLFHETVRPIFEQICSGCHSESSPEAGMSLGGHISSAAVVENLVNIQAMHGGQFKRIAPSQPEQSWLYLKVSGMAAAAGCTGAACNPQTMPPTGQVTLTPEQLEAIRNWIAQGAPAPEPATL